MVVGFGIISRVYWGDIKVDFAVYIVIFIILEGMFLHDILHQSVLVP